jgi:hypothetical protein
VHPTEVRNRAPTKACLKVITEEAKDARGHSRFDVRKQFMLAVSLSQGSWRLQLWMVVAGRE